jgi:hypothetical protein
MKRRIALFMAAALCLSLLTICPNQETARAQAQHAGSSAGNSAPSAGKITALNPLGNPPPITLIPMAQRSATLDGKTIYFVDDGFLGGEILLKEMIGWFGKNMPKVRTEFRKKAGGFAAEDPPLWAEIKEKGDAMVMATGH